MPPKRPNEGGHEAADSGRARKKQKIAAARTINVQTGVTPGTGVVTNSMKGLPGAIDVEKFTEARSFEITAMQSAMESAKGSSTQRAWQVLPRSLRRRAASHDVRRVPVRLREKAQAEMDPAKRKALGRLPPKRGKAKQLTRTQSFLKRQRDKSWLETHIWHAKRMHMKNIWGYRLSETPTEKSFRPSHRASIHGSILHDASYMSTISVFGKQSMLEKMLLICCDCQGAGPGAVRYTLGSRIHETHMYEPDAYPFALIAPITIIWKPLIPIQEPDSSGSAEASTSASNHEAPKKRRRRKGKEPETVEAVKKPDQDTPRTLWIRFHPSAWQDVWDALQKAASFTIDRVRKDNEAEAATQDASTDDPLLTKTKGKQKEQRGNKQPSGEESIELVDLRSQVNCFEIMGPKSTQIIMGALTLVNGDERPVFKDFWSQLKDLQTPGSVPRGTIAGMKVHDPRLNFPPKNAKLQIKKDGGLPSTSQAAPFTVYPTATLARSELWEAVERPGGTLRPRFRKTDLDERRRENLIPGTALKPLRHDDQIPLLLIQRTVIPSSSSGPSPSTPSTMHGWTLLLPPHWSMPFFSSLTHTGTRVGGLRERRTQTFEAGAPEFPFDYPGAAAYKREEKISAMVEQERWDKRPPAKRVKWEAVGTRSPWRADWEVVLGMEEEGMLPVQREDDVEPKEVVKMWFLRGPETPRIVEETFGAANPAVELQAKIRALRAKRGLGPLPGETGPAQLLQGAVVPVRLHLRGRGTPGDLAAIYPIAPSDNIERAELSAGMSDIIGYVSTGSYSLLQGKGAALGAISLCGLLRVMASGNFVKVKDREGSVCRAASIEVLAT